MPAPRCISPTSDQLADRIRALDELTQARFTTFEAVLHSESERAQLALEASDKAITKAEVAIEKRFESVNEFRAQLTEQSATYITKETVSAWLEASMRDRQELHRMVEQIRLDHKDSATVHDLTLIRGLIDELRTQHTRITASAVGISSAITAIAVLVAVVFRLASGH